jgi:hypothetical protein
MKAIVQVPCYNKERSLPEKMHGYDLRPLFSLHQYRANSDDRQENYLRTEKTMKLTGRDGHYPLQGHLSQL